MFRSLLPDQSLKTTSWIHRDGPGSQKDRVLAPNTKMQHMDVIRNAIKRKEVRHLLPNTEGTPETQRQEKTSSKFLSLWAGSVVLVLTGSWSSQSPDPHRVLVLTGSWSSQSPGPHRVLILTESWSSQGPDPHRVLILTESWSSQSPDPHRVLVLTESWFSQGPGPHRVLVLTGQRLSFPFKPRSKCCVKEVKEEEAEPGPRKLHETPRRRLRYEPRFFPSLPAAPDQNPPEQTGSERTGSEQTVSKQSGSEQTRSEKTRSEQSGSEQSFCSLQGTTGTREVRFLLRTLRFELEPH
ncbi:uncharacterized protein V6R79_025966 [Siganus canaliculatus]